MSFDYYLHVDYREKDLYLLISNLIEYKYSNLKIELCKSNLEIGDIIILNSKKEIINIIERKTLHDLLSSIKDGRYENQSERLKQHKLDNHNIMYLIEGNLSLPGLNENEKNMILSSIISINVFKGFSIIRTLNSIESSQYICRMLYKYTKNKYKNEIEKINVIDFTDEDNKETNLDLHISGLKKMKKNHEISRENINLCLLCQIPSINEKTANAIIQHYGNVTFDKIIENIREDPSSLHDIKICTNEKFRRINKTIVDNIINLLI
tara:strand:- start:1846 stop:2643 length:798 start_codon:yes stop_codon:yes gene_type:complete